VTERRDVTARVYRRFRCQVCGRQFNERSAGVLNRTCLPSDVTAFVVFCRLRYRLTLRDLCEILALRGIEISHEAARDWEGKLLPVMGDAPRKRRHRTRRSCGTSWYVDETYLKVSGCWAYLYRAIDRDGELIDAMLSEPKDMKASNTGTSWPSCPNSAQNRACFLPTMTLQKHELPDRRIAIHHEHSQRPPDPSR
jgi:hypothetical protein